MPEYRRIWQPGGTFFFTLVTNQRRAILTDEIARQALREAFQHGMEKVGAFRTDAFCLLPDHFHCIWTLPENDGDYATRWKVIKGYFSRRYLQLGGMPGEVSPSKVAKGELGVWQRRYWEHLIRDDADLQQHVDYIHYNPVKHGLVQKVEAWPWSSFHRYVQEGFYEADWGTADARLMALSAGEFDDA